MRLLVWNIERFTLKRISDASGKDEIEQANSQDRSAECLSFIIDNVQAADADVLVVLEALAPKGPINQLAAAGNGVQGLIRLREELSAKLNRNWFLVPPLRANPDVLDSNTYTETVGVFWRDDRVWFRGPLVWPQAPDGSPSPTGPPIQPGSGPAAAKYPAPWNDVMPRTLGDTNWAAQVALVPGANPTPTIGDRPTNRQPYITDFFEPATQRAIRLFSVHLPPNKTAPTALQSILQLQSSMWTPRPNEVVVIAGDMNIDLIRPTTNDSAHLRYMTTNAFVLLGPYPISMGAARSMLQPVDEADLDSYLKDHLYDYAFARYAAPPPARTFRSVVVDRVVGVRQVIQGEAPIQTFGTAMGLTPKQIEDSTYPVALFRRRRNYGRIRETSDHSALFTIV
jgi:hypothetical protein